MLMDLEFMKQPPAAPVTKVENIESKVLLSRMHVICYASVHSPCILLYLSIHSCPTVYLYVLQAAKGLFPKHINPFSEDILNNILSNLDEPLHKRGGYVTLSGCLPPVKVNTQV